MMKIFFSGSIRGGMGYRASYLQIVEFLQRYGDTISEHSDSGNPSGSQERVDDSIIYARDVGWIRDADLLIAEVSQPSIGVGYEIALAESLGIPVLALYDSRAVNPISAMISGNPRITLLRYDSLADLWPMLDAAIARTGSGTTLEVDEKAGQDIT
jgi:2'-deoxynucleoside 5'-phosphate N-hydrolase